MRKIAVIEPEAVETKAGELFPNSKTTRKIHFVFL